MQHKLMDVVCVLELPASPVKSINAFIVVMHCVSAKWGGKWWHFPTDATPPTPAELFSRACVRHSPKVRARNPRPVSPAGVTSLALPHAVVPGLL